MRSPRTAMLVVTLSAAAAHAGSPPASSPTSTQASRAAADHARAATAAAAASAQPLCSGDYADEPSALLPRVREFERDPHNQYSYCLRTTAVYECLSYGSDGAIRRARKSAVAHGTGFAYRRSGGETLLVTNDHVATWPAVTDEQHPVDDVPAGCKLVSDTVKIVDDEADDYEPNDVPLSRAATDPAADVAVLKTRAVLKLIPWKFGRSAALRVGNAVAVRGFPLGAFAATNLGKVVNAYDRDTDKDWDHADFVVDALLSPGNSGSPVLAVSCKTGEYELVGIYHAGYVRGSALNVVVGIDQVRDLMTTLKRPVRAVAVDSFGARERALLTVGLSAPAGSPFFPFGPLVASARLLPGGGLAFEVFGRGFPLRDERLLVVEDLPPPAAPEGTSLAAVPFGTPGRVYFGTPRGLREWPLGSLDAEAQSQLERVLTRLRAAAVSTARFRAADEATRGGHRQRSTVERELNRQAAVDRDAAQSVLDLADRLGPRPGETSLAVRNVLPAPPAHAPSPVAEKRKTK